MRGRKGGRLIAAWDDVMGPRKKLIADKIAKNMSGLGGLAIWGGMYGNE